MQCKSFNLLLLGHSGVGKSTLINSIANYFTYKSFEDAKGQEPVHIIPASFEMMDSDYKAYTVSIGTPDKNENLVTLAESCTQSPKIYGFRHDKCQINFIDVPGIGDTHGIDTDNKNIKAILDTVSLFDQLHAICILLKSTDTKLNTEYRYCLNELLLHLHQKAIPNVVFIFTNSQATGFVPGNARVVLNAYLAELKKTKGIDIPLSGDNMYCIDNDAFRFLCTYYQYPVFKKEDPSAFAKSWEKSQSAIKRLFKRNSGLIPHDVIHSLSINQARAIIISMIQPLAAITSLIQANSANYQTNFDDMVKKLQENLSVTEYDLKLEELQRPQTVCTGKGCIGVEIINGQVTTIYKQVCHSPCYLTGIVVKRVPEPGLINCAAMLNSKNCQWCRCSYEVHMHIDYNLKKILRPSRVGAELAKLGNIDKAKATTHLKDQMERLESEQQKVSEAMIMFAAYLKKNAIFEYNTAFEEKMKMEIRNEEVAAQNGADPTTLDRLNVILDNYIEQKKKMEAIYKSSNGDNVIDSTEVSALQNKLFQLPLYGEKIKELYNKNTTSNVSRTQNNIKIDYTFLINPF